MLFMVIEHYKDGNAAAVGERFERSGRMLPDGVIYGGSWMDISGSRCFQVMEAPSRDLLDEWMDRGRDIVDFDVVPVQDPTQFWAQLKQN